MIAAACFEAADGGHRNAVEWIGWQGSRREASLWGGEITGHPSRKPAAAVERGREANEKEDVKVRYKLSDLQM